MKFSVGDIVLLKNTGEEGRVAAIINHEMAEVEVYGTIFPVFMDEIEHPYLKWFLEKNNKPSSKINLQAEDFSIADHTAEIKVSRGFHFSFLPEFKIEAFDERVEKLRIYFINESPYNIQLQYECFGKHHSIFAHQAAIPSFSHFYLHDVSFDIMHEQPRFYWHLQQKENPQRQDSFSDLLRIKPKKLFDYIINLQRDNQPMFSIPIATDFPELKNDIVLPVNKISLRVEEKELDAIDNNPVYEIDLHIENLVADTAGMTNYDILKTQLNNFAKALDKATHLHQHSMIVIHGIGKGRLKEEVHAMVSNNKHVSHFHHEWMPEYGMGATKIFFK